MPNVATPPEIVSDYQNPKDLINVDRNSEIYYATVVDDQADSTDNRTRPTAADVVPKSDGSVDPMYAKVKKQKKSWNHLYSKPIKTKKKQQSAAADDHSSTRTPHNGGASFDDLYTKSKKQKRSKRSKRSDSETAAVDAMYTKPKKKRKNRTKNVDYANDLQLQKIRDGINTIDAVTEDTSKLTPEVTLK